MKRIDFYFRGRSINNFESFSYLKVKKGLAIINAEEIYYRDLNALLRKLSGDGIKKVEVRNVFGQRYIGTNLNGNIEIKVYGTPGNDLGAFVNGSNIFVYGNVQDGCGNTMNGGLIVVHGHAGDLAGYSMRKGKIFIRDDVGYRAGIHMKEYQNTRPLMVIGGSTRDFLGEYMAGGVILVLGLNLPEGECHRAKFVGTGMHGGVIYVRGEITNLGKEVEVTDVDKSDVRFIRSLVKESCGYFSFDFDEIMSRKFTKIVPISNRPYGKLYAY
jgi:glutamate synthase domain-containing protein 3